MEDRPDIGPAVLMIERAESEGDPWSGQMAFPGGKLDCDDDHITQAALRELDEELGIPHGKVIRIGRLSDVLARPYRINHKPMVVSPILCEATEALDLHPNEEVADVIWVPLSLFMDVSNRQIMSWQKNTNTIELPCYFYQGKRIWGLSLMMIDELISAVTSI